MYRISVIFSVLLFVFKLSLAQHKDELKNFPSPNAASFSVFGQIPVNNYTGIPNISIPLMEVKEGDISVPVELSYHSSSVQVNSVPGWTGLGMSLLCGGAITRVQRGYQDEHEGGDHRKYGYLYNFDKLVPSDWFSPAKIKQYSYNMLFPVGSNVDAMADEFQFNFLGYSGKFMLGDDGQWHVSGNDNIKVIVPVTDGIVHADQIRATIRSKLTSTYLQSHSYFFNKFTLVTADGTSYEFGGVNATEYSVPYRTQQSSYVVPTSWFLSKIKSPKGKEINFTYEPGDFIASLSQQYSYTRYNSAGGWFSALNPGCSGTAPNLSRVPANGYLIFPVYLRYITTSYSTIEFTRSISPGLKYSNFDLGSDVVGFPQVGQFTYFNDPLVDIKWAKLDRIRVLNQNSLPVQLFEFTYTSSPLTRLKLLSVTEHISGQSQSPFTFKYDPEPLPGFCSDQIDHWGYYNGFDVNSFVANSIAEWINLYPTARYPDTNGKFIRAELLSRVDYPTGGYTTFDYEPHSYSTAVDKDRTTLLPYGTDMPGGGARIKRISSYESDGTQLLTKDYFYVKNYFGQTDISALRSSGVLGGLTQYYWPGFHGKDLDDAQFTYDLFSSNSLLPSFMNGQGSHIGYSEVVEKTSGNGFTKYFHSNFETGVDGFSHGDEPALGNTDIDRSVYSPFTSKSLERGLPILIERYDKTNYKVQSTKISYQASSSAFVKSLELEHLDICSSPVTRQSFFGTAFKTYIYNFNKVREETTVFDSDRAGIGNTIVMQYHFDLNNCVDQIIQTNSDGKEKKTEMLYPSQIDNGLTLATDAEARAIQLMARTAHMLNYPIETTEFYDGKVVRSSVQTFVDQAPIIVPKNVYKTETSSPVSSYSKIKLTGTGASVLLSPNTLCKLTSSYKYDAFGNVTQVTAENGIVTAFVWGYKHLYPIAKIENASYQEVLTVLTQTTIDALNTSPGTDDQVRLTLQTLRSNATLKKSLITTYTYEKNNPLIGMTSETDPNNKTQYYVYDVFNRLRLVKDSDGNIIKKYEYNYQLR
ncbi:MAG: hypothetical protein ABI663_20285 [Chryseolinea sp.]